jgi:hypothetical protein
MLGRWMLKTTHRKPNIVRRRTSRRDRSSGICHSYLGEDAQGRLEFLGIALRNPSTTFLATIRVSDWLVHVSRQSFLCPCKTDRLHEAHVGEMS